MPSLPKHIPALDGLRAIAALGVICFHYSQGFSNGGRPLVDKLAVWGQTGVDLFFVLSGFLITGILLDGKGTGPLLKSFFARRALRIFPLYYAALIVFYAWGPLLYGVDVVHWNRGIWYWVYLQNIAATFAPGMAAGPGHFWSLAVEEHFYLVWPFVVLYANRRQLLWISGAAVTITIATRLLLILYGYDTFYFTLARLDGLALGGVLAILAREGLGGLSRLVPWSRRTLAVLAPSLAASQMLVSGQGLVALQVLKGTLIATVFACLMVLAIEGHLGRTLNRILASPILGSIGRVSYGMYVIHPSILAWLHSRAFGYSLTVLATGVSLTYAAAWISWTVFESRVLRLRRYVG